MKIKNRLSLYFTLISSGVLLAVFIAIYLSFVVFFRDDFYLHLKERANVTARLYLEADEISTDSLNKVRILYLNELPGEVVRIYNSDNNAEFIQDKMQYWNAAIINQVRQKGYLQFVEGNRQAVGIYYKDNQGNFVILVSASDFEGLHRLKQMWEIMLFLFVSVGISLFFISRWFAQGALLPLDKVVKQMQRIKANNLNLRVKEDHNKDEISELARNFNQLLEHLENAFEMQKTYIANASHELRTPVTSIIGEIEVALYRPRSEAEYQLLLRSILHDSEKLKETISNLMELAQVDADYTIAQQSNVRIDDLVWELQQQWNKKYGKKMLDVSMLQLPEDEAHLTLSVNRQLLIIALNNIIGNAFKFSEDKPVQLTLLADDKRIQIQVKDQGIGVTEINRDQIFNPFFRGENAYGFLGSGIGLYIADKVVRLFKGNISFHSVASKGSVFTIEFKAS
ncbi:sensor histidine kinase [Mucilaginibacter arboris]|uniref:histidine kinase n=1 Tax=Mucilaginibacter arboris TaxID=2682090 RepID=A0A7K1SX38_9SPHI|nr:HAMP domain-containing sensor histidine kinase [Mucilaginibacter arboris]MVN21889.1 HAMP domain-containing protein [Mucilaginibacter arboris]